MQKLLYITPHLSTGGAPQYLLKKIELLINDFDIHVIEYQDLGIFRVQKNKIIELLKNPLITLNDNKEKILEHIKNIQPDIIHFEEMPELFDISDDIADKIYVKDRLYKIFETSHDSAFEPAGKRFYPDMFLFCSDNQLLKFRSIDTPACVIEYPEYNFKGLKDGDKWCLCASRWVEAYEVGLAPKIILEATHIKTLDFISLQILENYKYL